MAAKTTKWIGGADGNWNNASNWDAGVPTSVAASAFYDTAIMSASALRGPSLNMDQTGIDGVNGLRLAEFRIEPGFRFNVGTSSAPLKCVITLLKHEGRTTSMYWQNQKGSGGTHLSARAVINSENTGTALMLTNSVALQKVEIVKGGVQVLSGAGLIGINGVFVGLRENALSDARMIWSVNTLTGPMYQTGGVVIMPGFGGNASEVIHQSGGTCVIDGSSSGAGTFGTYELFVHGGRMLFNAGAPAVGFAAGMIVGRGIVDFTGVASAHLNELVECRGSTVITNVGTTFGSRTIIGE